MSDTLDDFVSKLQEQIFEDTKDAYGEPAFERWENPLYMGAIKDPDAYSCLTGVCGDTMEIFLKFENQIVREASFKTDGCGSSVVCGSFAAEMSLGKNPDELLEITGDSILEKLEGLPEEDRHCAFLAAETLSEALHEYMIKITEK